MNYLWGGMILIGIVYGAFTGQMQAITDSVLNSAKEAVTLCITMAGVMSLWTGIMEIADKGGLIREMSKKLQPFLHFLFPKIPRKHRVLEAMSANMIANFLGLGWAATPAGLQAMEQLETLEEERRTQKSAGAMPKGVASDEMCNFLILNISSLQLIPVNIIAYRSQYGSVNPALVAGPAILATAVSTAAAILFCKIIYQVKNSHIQKRGETMKEEHN